MKISYNWLKSWVDVDLDVGALAEALTMAGLEVDGVEPAGPALESVVVGEVIDAAPHPNADRLSVCSVSYGGKETLNIVCGAPNARTGLKAPLAVVGAVLPNGLKIKKAKLRGQPSEGMLCSAIELGLGEEADGLMELPADAPVGNPLAEYLDLDDWIIDIDLTPNRGDCLSVRGLARDIAALTGAEVKPPAIEAVAPVSEREFPVELDAPADCARYVGRVIEEVDTNAATPRWMAERLRRGGIRPLGPVVDVTNYVLLELGQPMHAFDLDKLDGGIRVRRGRKGDRLTLLDGQEITPDESQLLITDHAAPVALAGVMGGQDSAVGEGSRNIFLESAWFNPAIILGKARALGMATESAHRFERGVDPGLQALAIERATALIIDIAGGRPGPVTDVSDPAHLPIPAAIDLRLERVNKLLGSELDADTVRNTLESLGMEVEMTVGGSSGPDGSGTESSRGQRPLPQLFSVTPPSARPDIALEVDLIEEVARVYGYNNLPETTPGGRLDVRVPSERRLPEAMLRDHLVARGFYQAITWSFVSEELLEQFCMAAGGQPLANPLSRDMGVLRTSLVPGLVQTAANNLRRQHARVHLFETGHCFINRDSGFDEPQRLGLLMAGAADPEHWSDGKRGVDFFDLKGCVERLLALGGGEGVFSPAGHPWLHPGQAAEVTVNGQTVGWLGQLHPGLTASLDVDHDIFVAELDLKQLLERPIPEYRSTPRFPAVRRDLSLLIPENTPCGDIVALARETTGAQLRDVVVFDQYQGKGVENGYKSVAIGLIFQDLSRTLKDQEIEDLVARVTSVLGTRINAKLRG